MRNIFIIFLFYNLNLFSQNEDFESSASGPITTSTQIQGWVFTSDSYSVFGAACSRYCDSLLVPMSASIITHPSSSGYIDSFIGAQYPIFSVFGNSQNTGLTNNNQLDGTFGNSFLKIGAASSNFYNVSKKIKVDHMNSIFRYAYIYATNPTYSIGCCHAAQLKIRVRNLTTSLPINSYSRIVMPNHLCATSPMDVFMHVGTLTYYDPPYGGDEGYTRWKIINVDLSNYIGDSVKVDFVVNGGSNFYCYAYLDAESRPGMIYSNGAINTTGTITSCSNATLSAPFGYNYNWSGPSINSITTQSFVANTTGIYSLTMSQGTTVIGTQTIYANIITPLPVNFAWGDDTLCVGQTTTLTINYSTIGHLQWFQWSTGSVLPSISITPTIPTAYYINAVDNQGCLTTFDKVIHVDLCTSIKAYENISGNLFFYPNPNTGSFTIRSNANENIMIYDNLGKLLQTVKLMDENDHVVQISGYKPGFYIFRSLNKVFKMTITD